MSIKYSIVATSYNDEGEIESFLHSIINQSCKPEEVIIADGGSKDSTVNIINRYSEKYPYIRVISNGRLNIAQGYNLAIKNTNTDLIGIVGIGNEYDCEFFTSLIKKMDEAKTDMVYSPIRGVDSTSFSVKYNRTFLNGEYGQRIKIPSNHGALVKKNIFEENGFFYEKFIYAGEDTEFYTLACKNGASCSLSEEAIVRWKSPMSFNQYYKMSKNYAIALMQIMNNKYLLKRIIKHLFPILLYFVFVVISPTYIKVCLLLLGLSYVCYLDYKCKKRNKYLPLVVFEYYIYPLTFFTNAKYMKKVYKVRRN
ncbi:glycosyltransferase [Butyrivibrio sp. AE2015]|uniref:glycosyltransferase n=1 Tax=Butyrivibrio sp. AE2015 TaxID=1280663 RepID=UPI0003B2E9D3|nr:glycosyltransferase [Butyrivibrio sp. AE2015]